MGGWGYTIQHHREHQEGFRPTDWKIIRDGRDLVAPVFGILLLLLLLVLYYIPTPRLCFVEVAGKKEE